MKAKQTTLLALLAFGAAFSQAAMPLVNDLNIAIDEAKGTLTLTFSLNPRDYKLKSNSELTLTPEISNGDSTVSLPGLVICGRNRALTYERGSRKALVGVPMLRAGKDEPADYRHTIQFRPWMRHSTASIDGLYSGCCDKAEGTETRPIASISTKPAITIGDEAYILPAIEPEEKFNEISGSAFVDFPVNRTEIHPNYRKNQSELARILATIDTVRTNPDATITDITIKGFASPEGSYANNERLAIGRTRSLTEYVRGQYDFGNTRFHTAYEPEDWAGLRRAIADGNLEERDALLEIIDSDLDPDTKDKTMRTRFPKAYARILSDIYPALRHSDYTVRYKIRQFTDIEELKDAFLNHRENLNLYELMLLAASYKPGSPEYAEVVMYALGRAPENPQLNLNAAALALQNKDYVLAEYYLRRAPENDLTARMREMIRRKGVNPLVITYETNN